MKLIKDEKTKTYLARFESWEEFLSFVKDAPSSLSLSSQESRKEDRHSDKSYSFTKTATFDAAFKLAMEGWQAGVDRIKEVALKDFNAVSDKIERPHYFYDVEGSDVDVARFIDGEPEVWIRSEEVLSEGPGRRVFHIIMNSSVSGAVQASTIEARGAAVIALIQAMELSGHGVSLTMSFASSPHNGAEKSEFYVPLKSADQHLDLPRLAFSLAHPSTLRRLIFSAMERLPWPREHGAGSSYGYPKETNEQGDIYFGCAHSGERNWNDAEVVKAWIVETMKKQGIQLREDMI